MIGALVLSFHAALSVALLSMLIAIPTGMVRGWTWARSPRLRVVHAALCVVIAARARWGVPCPLTMLERSVTTATEEPAVLTLVARRLVFRDMDASHFAAGASAVALAALVCLLAFPPAWRQLRRHPLGAS